MTNLNILRGSVLLLSAALASCAVGPNYVKPETQAAPQFEGARDGAFSTADAQAKFWTQFGDDNLNRLVDEALDANHDLRIALGRLLEARAIRREAGFDLAPTVTAAGGYTKERFPAVDSPTGAPLATQRRKHPESSKSCRISKGRSEAMPARPRSAANRVVRASAATNTGIERI